mgnify:FL=1
MFQSSTADESITQKLSLVMIVTVSDPLTVLLKLNQQIVNRDERITAPSGVNDSSETENISSGTIRTDTSVSPISA